MIPGKPQWPDTIEFACLVALRRLYDRRHNSPVSFAEHHHAWLNGLYRNRTVRSCDESTGRHAFVDRPVRIVRHGIRFGLDGSPEVGDEPIEIVDRLNTRLVGSAQEDGQRTGKRLDIIRHVAKAFPDDRRDAGFPAEPGEGRL